ncbi:NAD(P)H-dependent oxidoreductase [Candidatus Berkelbacteria bacterium]|nr:NAD(P)H-dependent oxidoreductase [Candidatus Berkelbacteria bacterium]
MQPHIQIIIASVRDNRKGDKVARWVYEQASKRDDATFELVDLKEWELPMFADAKLPSMGEYSTDIARKWAASVGKADGYIFVTPEYNHGYPASLKNALDYLYKEWNKKPAAFVSYGGQAGGARSVEQLRQITIELEMVPLRSAIVLPAIRSMLTEQGTLIDDEARSGAATKLLDEIIWWAAFLKGARESVS